MTSLKEYQFRSVKISNTNLMEVSKTVSNALSTFAKGYICVTDVGNVVNAYRKNEKLKEAINESFLSLPDGRPLSVFGKLTGIKEIGRVSGADVLKLLLSKNYSHCFIGDTGELHSRLTGYVKINYPNAVIKGAYSPPFREWSEIDNQEIISRINHFDADIVWISFGGGKQEIWMHDNLHRIKRGMMIGIGAGFRWFLGDIRQAPPLFQKLSLEWLFRLIQQPGMFRRYANTLPFFLKDAVIDLIKIKFLRNNPHFFF